MGAYLSEPVVEKESSDIQGNLVDCGSSSMQGWRVTQEDAHNCLLDFDTDTSFFAVYDGHGGNEVAVYCGANLPEFLKECELYKKGDFVEALKQAFLEFDAKLATPEVVSVLKEIVGNKDGRPNSVSDDDEDTVRNLYEEAAMPLEQVMARYTLDGNPAVKKLATEGGFKSPLIRGKRACTSGASGSGTSAQKLFVPASDTEVSSLNNSAGQSSSNLAKVDSPKKGIQAESDEKNVNGNSEIDAEASIEQKNGVSEPDSSADIIEKEAIVHDKEEKTDSKPDASEVSPVKKLEMNGERGDGDSITKGASDAGDNVTSSSVPHENGDAAPYEGKGKGKAKMSVTEVSSVSVTAGLRRLAASVMYSSILKANEEGSDSDSDSDENFEGAQSSSEDEDDDDDGAEGNAEDGEEDDEEDDDEDDDDDDSEVDEEDDEEDDDFTMKMTEEPGYDSGCTAVVALLRGRELYVANAGDSRCIVCRKGEAVEMSFDHKPEDQLESDRIVKAGGKVTADGRVNGGLNLSRALGDHAYKLKAELPAQEQMITALPDVRTLTIDPADDEFMVLACDGIWNFMSSQEVCDFVRPRLQEGKEKLSTICEELFDHCLAPNTLGDGTGCDNMTALIVKFHPTLAAIVTENKSAKRPASPAKDEEVKRAKTDEPLPV